MAGPSRWGEFAADCSFDRQSPIDIQTGYVLFNETLKEFTMEGYDVTEKQDWKIKNSGRSGEIYHNTTLKVIVQGHVIYRKASVILQGVTFLLFYILQFRLIYQDTTP